MRKSILVTDETISGKIYFMRGKKVMLDRDLAELYGVETRALNQAVKRNAKRFPPDFMFQMNDKELKIWMSQFVTSKKEMMGVRKMPNVFTEQGVAMLSSVLNSSIAIEVNIQIIRVFTRMREVLLTHKDFFLKLEQLEKKILQQDKRTNKAEEDIQLIFGTLKQFLNPPKKARKLIGFKHTA